MNQLESIRTEIDHFLKHHPQSPLEFETRSSFQGLDYYEFNPNLIFEVDIEPFPDDESLVLMQTSTGDEQQFRRWGRFSFEIGGVQASLTIYSSPHGHDFFMPFKDATNGKETYGAGRYLDDHRPGFRPISSGKFEVDFNYAYNPYCAYSPHYSCPLPPRENWISVPVEAGEKDYHSHEER